MTQATRIPASLALPLASAQRLGAFAYGRRYREHRALLDAHRARYDATPALLRMVNHALANVPFYRQRYPGQSIRTVDELAGLVEPISRDDVGAHHDELMCDGIDRAAYDVCTTGGTSGPPLRFLAPKARYAVELATMHALWAEAGFSFDVRAVIRNHHVDSATGFVVNPITREVIFDGFRLAQGDLLRVYARIHQLRIRFVHCYPSTAYELASVIDQRGLDASGLVFLSGSENVFAYQRELIQQRLGIRFYNWYGHSEKLVLAGYCRSSDLYHVEPTYGYCELLDERGQRVTRVGDVGEIVGTTLHNPGFPLLRYRTGDLAELAGDQCDACGRRVMLLRNIRGRWSGERVYRADGTFVTTTALNLHDDIFAVIRGLQYVQEQRGMLDVLVVRAAAYDSGHEKRLLEQLRSKLGPEIVLNVRYVGQLLRQPNGKFTQLISRLPQVAR